jgi:hypothetical protein
MPITACSEVQADASPDKGSTYTGACLLQKDGEASSIRRHGVTFLRQPVALMGAFLVSSVFRNATGW